jgi:predicted dehydrogenase
VLIPWLLGRAVRRVSAATANYFFRENQQHDMEDFGVLLLELDGGITASLAVGRTGWRSHPMGGVNRVTLVGTKGVACVDAYRPRLEVWSDEPPWTAPRPDPDDPMAFWGSTTRRLGVPPKRAWITPEDDPGADARHFLDCLEHGRSSDVPAAAGAAAMEVLLAAYESAATGQTITLPQAGS